MPGKHNAAGARITMNTDNKPSPRTRAMYAQKSEKNPVVKLGPDIKAKIGMQLRLMYGEVVDQGVPERFAEMLKRLDDPNYEGK
jgi:Anti-sigma factor NepR